MMADIVCWTIRNISWVITGCVVAVWVAVTPAFLRFMGLL